MQYSICHQLPVERWHFELDVVAVVTTQNRPKQWKRMVGVTEKIMSLFGTVLLSEQ